MKCYEAGVYDNIHHSYSDYTSCLYSLFFYLPSFFSFSESDSATVDKNVAKKCNVYYEAQLQTPTKPKRVYCYPTSKQIQIKEYFFMGIFPKRLYTCKVCPLTRVSVYINILKLLSECVY